MSAPAPRSSVETSETKRPPYQATFAVITTGVVAYALLQSLVVPAMPVLQHDLHTSQSTVTWVLTAYLLSASIFTPIMGRIGDMVGKGRIFVVTLMFLAVGCLIAAVAPNIAIMILARVVQGVGGGVLPLAFGVIRDEFPEERVSSAIGSIAALSAVGGGAGTVIAGPIIDALSYRWLFWLPLIACVCAAIAAHFLVPDSPVRSGGHISWKPAVLLSLWLVALLVALSEAPTWGWGSTKVIGLVVLAVVVAAAWIASEQRARTPLIDMRMMRLRGVWTANLVALLIGVGMYAGFAFLPEFVQTPKISGYGFGASITAAGLIILPSTVTMFVVGQFSGRLGERFGARSLVFVGSVIAGASFFMVAFAHAHRWQLFTATAVQGVGFGLAFTALSALVVEAVTAEQTGVASGMNANIRTIGGSIGAAVMSSIVTGRLEPNGLPAESGYTAGFAMLAGSLLLGALAALLVPATFGHRKLPQDEPAHTQIGFIAGATLIGDKPE